MDKVIAFKTRTEALTQLFFSHYISVVRETGMSHLIVEEKGRLDDLGLNVDELPLGPFNLLKQINPRTSLLSLSWAHPLTGVIRPLEELAVICKERRIIFHVDITMLGKTDIPADFLTFTGKNHTFVIARENFCPLFFEELEAETIEIEEAARHFDRLCTETARLRAKFEEGLAGDVHILYQDCERSPHLSAISFPGIHHEALLFLLHRKKVKAKPVGEDAISFQFSHETTDEEIDTLLETVNACVSKLQLIGAYL